MAGNRLAKAIDLGPLGVTHPPTIAIEAPGFSGSLERLFELVRDSRVDLLQVPIMPICQAYLEYLVGISGEDIDTAAAALLALAYLLERKAWMLLPSDEPEPQDLELPSALTNDSIAELRVAMQALETLREERMKSFFRQPTDRQLELLAPLQLDSVTTRHLAIALERLLARAEPDPVPLAPMRRSLADQMTLARGRLGSAWTNLEALLGDSFTRSECVWWFLALLELIRLGQAQVRLLEDSLQFRAAG